MLEPQKTIIFNRDFSKSIKTALNSASYVYIFSAFVKTSALTWLSKNINKNTKIKIIARWKLNDLLMGASDIEAYIFAKKMNWEFAINTNMHFKIYLIDETKLFVGSANLTKSGLHLNSFGNDEASVLIIPNSIDILQLKKYAESCCTIDDKLYDELVEDYNKNKTPNIVKQKTWKHNIKNKLLKGVNHLWVHDLLFNSPYSLQSPKNEYSNHDCALLKIGGEISFNKENLLSGFKSILLWDWLLNQIANSENEFIRFGEVTERLHNSLLDDPKPYRKEVKHFVSNLFEWVRFLSPYEIGIKAFNHTEALFLQKK